MEVIPPIAQTQTRGKTESDSYSSDSENDNAPRTSVVLGLGAFGGKGIPADFVCGGKKGGKKGFLSPKSKKKKPHFRRLRMANPSKRTATEDVDESDEEKSPKKKKRRGGGVSEPAEVREADARLIEPHPAVMFMREHTPVKPCGRCRECRGEPCGECANCKNNAHLTDRSHDRKRCTTLGCTRLAEDELERYRLAHDSADSVAKIESDLRDLRDRFMAATTKGTSAENLRKLNQDQERLMKRLQTLSKTSEALESEGAPEGYGCLLLSFQTLETERDRVSRLIERRTTRDSPEIMRTRRQLRNFYALTICNMVRMFANDVVARPHVEKLRGISEDYEKLVRSLPISA